MNYRNSLDAEIFPENRIGKTVGRLQLGTKKDAPPLPAALVDRGRRGSWARFYSPSTRRLCSSRISSAMLVRDNRTSSANGAFGRQERHDSAGIRLVTATDRP